MAFHEVLTSTILHNSQNMVRLQSRSLSFLSLHLGNEDDWVRTFYILITIQLLLSVSKTQNQIQRATMYCYETVNIRIRIRSKSTFEQDSVSANRLSGLNPIKRSVLLPSGWNKWEASGPWSLNLLLVKSKNVPILFLLEGYDGLIFDFSIYSNGNWDSSLCWRRYWGETAL